MSYPTRSQLFFMALILVGSFSAVSGQGRGVNAERARAIEQAEMDRLLLWAIPKNESESTRQSRLNKIKKDKREIP